MHNRVRLPEYTLRRHQALVYQLKQDAQTTCGQAYFRELLGDNSQHWDVPLKAIVKRNFRTPVQAFTSRVTRVETDDMTNDKVVASSLHRLAGRLPPGKQICICRALVTCGLIAGPECFPAAYQERVHSINSAKGNFDKHLEALVPHDLSTMEVQATRGTQLLITEIEADLGRYWQGPAHDISEACEWCPKDGQPLLIISNRFRSRMKRWEEDQRRVASNGGRPIPPHPR